MNIGISAADYNPDDNQHSEGTYINEEIPKAEYALVINSCDEQPNKKENGRNIIMDFQIIGGDKNGIKFRKWFAYDNPSSDARNIAKRHLQAICAATGIPGINEPNDVLKFEGKVVAAICEREVNGDFVETHEFIVKASTATQHQVTETATAEKRPAEDKFLDDDIPF